MLKWSGLAFQKQFLRLVQLIWDQCELPNEWLTSNIAPILKPGEPLNKPKSYRPIALISALFKVFSKLLEGRASAFVEENRLLPDEQQGFRKRRSCPEFTLALKELCELRAHINLKTYIAFMDISNAFPSTFQRPFP